MQDIKMEVENWKMLRYNEMPEFELYSDQLIGIVEEQMKLFNLINPYQNITQSMVNNYVKAKVMDKPIKKKYGRNQLATLIVISMLKTVFSIGEIQQGIEIATASSSYEEAYDEFCNLMETSLKELFLKEYFNNEKDNSYIAIACRSVVSKLCVQYFLLKEKEVLENE